MTGCPTQEVELMTDLRKLDVSWNAPLVLTRSDAHLFAGLLCFQHLTVRAWDNVKWNETQLQQIWTESLFQHDGALICNNVACVVVRQLA